MIWIILVCGLLGWTLVSLPFAVAVGRAFSAGRRFDEVVAEHPAHAPREENGTGTAVA